MLCPTHEQLNAYYDHQLDVAVAAEGSGSVAGETAQDWAAIEKHIASCAACAAELARLAELSRLFAAAEQPRFAGAMSRRLHARADAFMERNLERNVRRLAWMVDAIAACLLVASSIWLMHGQSSASATGPAAPPPWVKIDAPNDGDIDSVAREGPVAQWYLADASSNRDDQ